MKAPDTPDTAVLPNVYSALRFICCCFEIGEAELGIALENARRSTPDANKHFPNKISRTLISRAESGNGPWLAALGTLRREALYDRIRRKLNQ